MQKFCEECGAKLPKGVRFCENCGAKIEDVPEPKKDKKQSSSKDFESTAISEIGIIYTDVNKIASSMNASSDDVTQIILDFISSSRSRGVDYSLYNAANSQNVDDHISAIKNAVAEKGAKYVFIIGSWNVVPQMLWKNPAGDSDKEVPSDLPYSMLSSTDPAKGVKFNFDSALRVGRLPVYEGENIECFRRYFENVTLHSGKFSSHVSFGETALKWKLTSESVYAPFKNGSLVNSPDFSYQTVDAQIPENANLLFFNLHGSDQTKYWYGQKDNQYPEAFAPENIKNLVTPNFIGVEACYGAKYNGYDSDTSIVLAALETNSLGLLGSSKIAFGVPGTTKDMCCADIIVREFLSNIKSGMPSGDAATEARKVLWKYANSDNDVKTLMEFDLYGDPTARMKQLQESPAGSKQINFGKSAAAEKSSSLPSLKFVMPDITRAIQTSLSRVNEKINEQVNRYVWDTFKEMDGITPKTYSVQFGMKKTFKNVYEKKSGEIENSIIAYFEPNGKITTVLGTK